MEKIITKTSLTEFLIEDFKDTSAKLESTDKKVQFMVQIYTALVTAIITASLYFLANYFNNINLSANNFNNILVILNNNSVLKTDSIIFPIFGIILIFLLGFSICVYYYSLRGNYIHAIYLNRMNFLRNAIFKKTGNFPDQIENYFYTKRSIVKVGMGNVLNMFLASTIGLYISFSFALLILIVSGKSILWYYFILMLIIVFILIVILYHFINKHYNKKAEEAIEKGWGKN